MTAAKCAALLALILLGCGPAADDDGGILGRPPKLYAVESRGPSGTPVTAWCAEGDHVALGGAQSPTNIRVSAPRAETEPPFRDGWECIDTPGNAEDRVTCIAWCRK